MKNLWIFSKIPDAKHKTFLKRMIDEDDALVLIQDGTYFMLQVDFDAGCPVYALKSDIVARGIEAKITQITYAELIDLIFKYERSITI